MRLTLILSLLLSASALAQSNNSESGLKDLVGLGITFDLSSAKHPAERTPEEELVRLSEVIRGVERLDSEHSGTCADEQEQYRFSDRTYAEVRGDCRIGSVPGHAVGYGCKSSTDGTRIGVGFGKRRSVTLGASSPF